MHWKRQGNELEWIVRQMSFAATWTSTGKDLDAQRYATKAKSLDKKKSWHKNKSEPEDPAIAPLLSTPVSHASTTKQDYTEIEDVIPDAVDIDDENASQVCSTESLRSLQDAYVEPDVDLQDMIPPALDDNTTVHDTIVDPQDLWSRLPLVTAHDYHGYNRCPAEWFTLNYPYNYSFDLHRFHTAIRELHGEKADDTFPDISARCKWVLDNPDLAAVMHAIRAEVNIRYVIANTIPCTVKQPYQYWARFEWGTNGNPHCHGQGYVANNPSFENITQDEETRQALIKAGYPDAIKLQTKEQCKAELGSFFNKHVD